MVQTPACPAGQPASPPPDTTAALLKFVRGQRRRRRLDDRDPSEDSELEPGESFDLAGALRNHVGPPGSATALDTNAMVDPGRVEHLRHAAMRRCDTGVPYVAATSLELWTPKWVGLGMPRSEKHKLARRREQTLVTHAMRVSNSVAFWLAHALIDPCSLAAVPDSEHCRSIALARIPNVRFELGAGPRRQRAHAHRLEGWLRRGHPRPLPEPLVVGGFPC